MALTFSPPPVDRAEEILTPEALAFVEELHQRFAATRAELLKARAPRASRWPAPAGWTSCRTPRDIRDGDWSVAPAPPALQDRRVEMTGPAAPAKMAINALNSGAKVWLADLEDASTPHLAQRDRIASSTSATPRRAPWPTPRPKARNTRCAPTPRWPSSWPAPRLAHGRAPSADRRRTHRGRPGGLRPALLPHRQAAAGRTATAPTTTCPRWRATSRPGSGTRSSSSPRTTLGIPQGSIRATVLIETIPAAFEMDEILYELRDHASGLNAGRWDYLFSIIKYFRDAGPRLCPARPRHRRHDRAVHARLHRAAGQDLPPPRRLRDGRHGGRHPQPPRTRGDRPGLREGARGQDPRGERRLRRLLGGPPGPGAGLPRGLRRRPGRTAEPAGQAAPGRSRSPRTSSWTSPPPRARSPRRACA